MSSVTPATFTMEALKQKIREVNKDLMVIQTNIVDDSHSKDELKEFEAHAAQKQQELDALRAQLKEVKAKGAASPQAAQASALPRDNNPQQTSSPQGECSSEDTTAARPPVKVAPLASGSSLLPPASKAISKLSAPRRRSLEGGAAEGASSASKSRRASSAIMARLQAKKTQKEAEGGGSRSAQTHHTTSKESSPTGSVVSIKSGQDLDPEDSERALKAEVASLNDTLFQLQQKMLGMTDAAEMAELEKKQISLDAKLRTAVKKLKEAKQLQRRSSLGTSNPETTKSPENSKDSMDSLPQSPAHQPQQITFMFPDGKEVSHGFKQSSSLQAAVSFVADQIQHAADDFDFVFNGEIMDLSRQISEVGFSPGGDQVQAVAKAEDQDAMQQLFMGMESASFVDEDIFSPEEEGETASSAPKPQDAVAMVHEEHKEPSTPDPSVNSALESRLDAEKSPQDSLAEADIHHGKESAKRLKADAKTKPQTLKAKAESEAAPKERDDEAKKRLDEAAEGAGLQRANVLKGILARRLQRRGLGS